MCWKIYSFIVLQFLIVKGMNADALNSPRIAEELRSRDGLPNFFYKIEAKQLVRVAYLGGSITAAEGWRVKSLDWLKQQYPEVAFKMIDASVSGTGADFAVCRLEEFVLRYHPDLVFVEYRVNGGGDYPEEAFEGILRRIWEASPKTDICLIYTIGQWMVSDLSEGRQFYYGIMMEELANHYGVPSIDLGVEVVRLLRNGELAMNAETRPENKIWFTRDLCHPTEEGHELYAKIVSRSLMQVRDVEGGVFRRQLPEALHSNYFNRSKFLSILDSERSEGWELVDVEKDPVYTSDHFRTQAMLGDAIQCSKIGESVAFEWEGRHLAMTYIPQGSGIEVEVAVDGQEPEVFRLEQAEYDALYARHFYLKVQSPGKHRAQLTVTQLPEGSVVHIGRCLQLGR